MRQQEVRTFARPDNTGNPEGKGPQRLRIFPCILVLCAAWLIYHIGKADDIDELVLSFRGAIASVVAFISSDREPTPFVPKSGIDQNVLEGFLARGQEFYAKDKLQAAVWFRKAAEQGHAEAQYRLAEMYAGGEGVGFSLKQALKWFRRAAEQGNAAAQYKMGILCMEGETRPPDMAQAMEWFRKAAEQGNAGAQCDLGVMYAEGMGVPRDDAQAMEWFRKAAEQGSAEAQYNLGVMYAGGEGVPPDMAQALKWFRKAAEQGNAAAQNYLGIMYCNGYGVAKDRHEAARWFRKAADQGQRNALEAMRQEEIAGADKENARQGGQPR